jgi:hypothetical protein
VSAALLIPAAAMAHFVLLSPSSHLVEDKLGNPQKAFPCGENDAIKGAQTGVVSEVLGGELMHLKVQETVYHPGQYRVALAVNSLQELPADPEPITREGPKGPISVSGKIEKNPKPPILIDGLFIHSTKAEPGSFWEAEILIPNINCKGCVIQVDQFMNEHGLNTPGDFTYHHCAVVNITATPKMKINKAWPKQVKTITSLEGPKYVKPVFTNSLPATAQKADMPAMPAH